MHKIAPRLTFRIDPLFFVLAFGIGWLNSNGILDVFLWALVIFISILVHELGHALTALSFGQSAQITFMPLGGLTARAGPPIGSLKEFLIVLNGPLAGFFLYFVCRFFLEVKTFETGSSLGFMLLIGSYVNLVWTILNLFPVLPLDGGRLMMIVLERLFGVRGGRVAYGISLVFAVVFALFFFLIQEFFAGAIFLLFAFESYREYSLGKIITPIDEDINLKQSLKKGIEYYRGGDISAAIKELEEVKEKSQKGLIHLTATYYLAKSFEEESEIEKAYLLLKPEEKNLNSEQLQDFQRLCFLTKRFKEAALIGSEVFRERPSANTALLNALSLSQQKEVIPSVGWFETAIRQGLDNPLQASRHLSFDPIRNSLEFQNLINKLTLLNRDV